LIFAANDDSKESLSWCATFIKNFDRGRFGNVADDVDFSEAMAHDLFVVTK